VLRLRRWKSRFGAERVLTSLVDPTSFQEPVWFSISSTVSGYSDSLMISEGIDVLSYLNTDAFQSLWRRDIGLLWCRTASDEEDGLAARFAHDVNKGHTQRALYFSCFEQGPAKHQVQGTRSNTADATQFLTAFYNTLISEVSVGMMTQRGSLAMGATVANSSARAKKMPLEILKATTSPRMLYEELVSLLSQQLLPVLVCIEHVDKLEDLYLHELLSIHKRLIQSFPESLRFVVTARVTELLLRRFTSIPTVDSKTELQGNLGLLFSSRIH
jgi:hypothetical protein